MGIPLEIWAAIGLAIFFLSTIGILYKSWDENQRAHAPVGERSGSKRDPSRNVPANETPREQVAQRPRIENRPVLREFTIGINPTDQNAYASFVPFKFIPRLQVCLDQSGYGDGMVSLPAWTSRHRSILKTLQDLTPGVRYTVAMTSLGERQMPNNNENFLKWDNTNTPVASSGMYRGRVALIVPDEPEIRRYFFAVPFHHQNLGRTALQIIDQSHFSFVEEWEAEDHG